MEIRNVLERLKLLTNDDREDLLLMLSGDAVQRLKARLCCTVEEENAHEEALCAAAAAQAAYQFWLLEEAGIAEKPDGGRCAQRNLTKAAKGALAYAKQCERGGAPGFCVTRIFTSA